jgi:mRNA interferase RelE/StbE
VHPVRFTTAAAADLAALHRRDPQIVRSVLAKVLLLERDPYAGRPLVGDLIGWRKLVVGNRRWRIVWRVVREEDGTTSVEVSEIWAVGAREDASVYDEVRRRLASAPPSPETRHLAELLGRFGQSGPAAVGQEAESSGARQSEPVPGWLVDRLVDKAGLDRGTVQEMALDEAILRWEEWMSGGPQR